MQFGPVTELSKAISSLPERGQCDLFHRLWRGLNEIIHESLSPGHSGQAVGKGAEPTASFKAVVLNLGSKMELPPEPPPPPPNLLDPPTEILIELVWGAGGVWEFLKAPLGILKCSSG